MMIKFRGREAIAANTGWISAKRSIGTYALGPAQSLSQWDLMKETRF